MYTATVSILEASEAHIRDVTTHARSLRARMDTLRNALIRRAVFPDEPIRIEMRAQRSRG